MKRIIRNMIKCNHCGDVIESHTVHDFRFCSCEACAVDGGHQYLRRLYRTSAKEDFTELSVFGEPGEKEDEDNE